MNIIWDKDFSKELYAVIEPLVEQYKKLLPKWLHSLEVQYRRDEDIAAVELNYRSRWAVLHIGRDFLTESIPARHNAIVHEFVHINLEPIQRAFELLVKGFPKDAQQLIRSVYGDGREASVTDLAATILELFDETISGDLK